MTQRTSTTEPISEPTAGPPARDDGIVVRAVAAVVKVVVVVLVLPVRLAWDALAAGGRWLHRNAARPIGRALRWVGSGLLWVLTPVARGLVRVLRVVADGISWVGDRIDTVVSWIGGGLGAGARWLYRRTLTPVGHGLAWLAKYLVAVPAVALYEYLLTPIGHGVRRTMRALWRHVLAPVGRAIGSALAAAWSVASRISRAIGRGIAAVARTIGWPLRWTYRVALTPIGHALRRSSHAVGRIVRQARADVRRVLFDAPRSGGKGTTMDR
jgi:hypothetical protein